MAAHGPGGATPADRTLRVTLTGVRSLTHLVYAASYLRHLLDADGTALEVGLVGLAPGLGRAVVTPEDVRAYLPSDDRLALDLDVSEEHFLVRPDRERLLLSIGAPGLRVWSRMVRAGRGRPPRVVVVDEGIGSYGDVRTRLAAYRREGGGRAWPVVRASAVASGNRILTDVHWSLYRSTRAGWIVDREVAAEFARRLEGPASPAGVAVYLTQPWPEVGIMAESDYLAHLDAVREQCASAGLRLVLRPHPSEDPDRYRGHDLLASRLPAELDASVVTAAAVVGANSTALLNLAAVHGTRCVRVTAEDLRPLERALGARQRSLLDTFLPPAIEVDRLGDRLRELRDEGAAG